MIFYKIHSKNVWNIGSIYPKRNQIHRSKPYTEVRHMTAPNHCNADHYETTISIVSICLDTIFSLFKNEQSWSFIFSSPAEGGYRAPIKDMNQ